MYRADRAHVRWSMLARVDRAIPDADRLRAVARRLGADVATHTFALTLDDGTRLDFTAPSRHFHRYRKLLPVAPRMRCIRPQLPMHPR